MLHEEENLQYESANSSAFSAFSAHSLQRVTSHASFKQNAVHTIKVELLVFCFCAPEFLNINYY